MNKFFPTSRAFLHTFGKEVVAFEGLLSHELGNKSGRKFRGRARGTYIDSTSTYNHETSFLLSMRVRKNMVLDSCLDVLCVWFFAGKEVSGKKSERFFEVERRQEEAKNNG